MSDYQEVERLYKNVFEKKKDFESALHKYLDEIELYLQCYYRDDCLYDIFDEIYWLDTIIENARERVNCNLGKPKQHELLFFEGAKILIAADCTAYAIIFKICQNNKKL